MSRLILSERQGREEGGERERERESVTHVHAQSFSTILDFMWVCNGFVYACIVQQRMDRATKRDTERARERERERERETKP